MLIDSHWCWNKVQPCFILSERTPRASPVIFKFWLAQHHSVTIVTMDPYNYCINATENTSHYRTCSAQHDWRYSNNSELTQLNATHLWRLSTTSFSIFTCQSILTSLLILAILKVHSFNANSIKGPSNPTWRTILCGRRIMVYPQLAGRRQIGARVTLDCPSVLA